MSTAATAPETRLVSRLLVLHKVDNLVGYP